MQASRLSKVAGFTNSHLNSSISYRIRKFFRDSCRFLHLIACQILKGPIGHERVVFCVNFPFSIQKRIHHVLSSFSFIHSILEHFSLFKDRASCGVMSLHF
ncbi:hypothetical protein ABW19_dt0210228 [Dactylella cylindrospora]|nr:hypothetical protein ABW19_dt0210228 [Dactylella cylindrospora]